MNKLDPRSLETYLSRLFSSPVRLTGLAALGDTLQPDSVKEYGYGKPVSLQFEVDGQTRRAVLHTIKPGPFGHEHLADRAGELLWCHEVFNRLPRHVRSLDVGGFLPNHLPTSLGPIDEFFLLTDYVEGSEYAHDLVRLREGGSMTPLDRHRADALCDYLIEIHRVKTKQPGLYIRRVRELIGHHQCIMGLIDSYPTDHPWITSSMLESIERKTIAWRWKMKARTHRLAQVHGDFHPWNILFEEDSTRFHVLDRSRGEWGDPADDVTSITLNYVFESLQATGQLTGVFADLYHRFWDRYLAATGDREMLEIAGLFVAFRGLVMASPVWYPQIDEGVRRQMMTLVHASLDRENFEPGETQAYLEAPPG